MVIDRHLAPKQSLFSHNTMAAAVSDPINHDVAHRGQQDDNIRELGLDEAQMRRFGNMLHILSLEAIPTFASKIRQRGHQNTGILLSKSSYDSDLIPCKTIGPPLCGSFNIVFTLEFEDGIKWMLKISANGHRFDPVAAAALISEARTMRLLKKETTIPIPAVYAFDSSCQNELHVPFILMERIDGKPLYSGWFDTTIPKARLEHFRVKALQSLAEAVVQLNKFTLNRSGALEFDHTGRPIGLRGAKIDDVVAMRNRETESQDDVEARQENVHIRGLHNWSGECECSDCVRRMDGENEVHHEKEESEQEDKSDEGDESEEEDEEEDEDIVCEKGPFKNPKSEFLFNLDRPDACRPENDYTFGCNKALRMFIDLAFSNSDDHGRQFVLSHPDLDVQNILVAEDGTLRGLIDWDGVASVPREVGCAQYPLWLMRDWVPDLYRYDIREGKMLEDNGYEESSPAELASYRALYAHLMEKELERQTGGADRITAFNTLPKQEAQLTRRSLVMRILNFAASSPFLTEGIMSHIVDQIEQVTKPEWGDMDMDMDTDSSASNEDSVDHDFGTSSDTNSGNEEADSEAEATKIDEYDTGHMAKAATIDHIDQGVVTSEYDSTHTLSRKTVSSSNLQQHDQESQTFSQTEQREVRALKTEQTPSVTLTPEKSSRSTRLGWGRRFLCFGCDTAEKGLRRIAKIGHVLEEAVEEVAEALASVEVQQIEETQNLTEAGPEQSVRSLDNQQMNAVEVSEIFSLNQHLDHHPAKDMAEPGQLGELLSAHAIVGMQEGFPPQDTIKPDQSSEVASTQPLTKAQDIAKRKAELLKAEKAKKGAHYRGDKARIKKELKVWESIALAVWVRGVSLEQLELNQDKIARLVVDTLHSEGGKKDDREARPCLLSELGLGGEEGVKTDDRREELQMKEVAIEEAKIEARVLSAACEVAAIPKIILSKRRSLITGHEGSFQKPTSRITDKSAPKFADENVELERSTQQPLSGVCLGRSSRTSKLKGLHENKVYSVTVKGDTMMLGKQQKVLFPLESPAPIPHPGAFVTVNQTVIASTQDQSASEVAIERKTVIHGDEVVEPAPRARFTHSSRPQPTPEDHIHSGKASNSFKDLCSSDTSCLNKFFSSNHGPEDDKESSGLDSSGNSSQTCDTNRSDSDDSCKSSATSLSENGVGLDGNVEAKEKSGDHFVMAAIPATQHHDGERDKLNDDEVEETTADSKPAQVHEEWLYAKTDADAEEAGDDIDGEDDEEDMLAFGDIGDSGEIRSKNILTLLGQGNLDELRLLRLQEGFLKLLEQY